MAVTRLTLSASVWQSLGIGPFAAQVLTGTAVFLASDKRPDVSDITGRIVPAVVGNAMFALPQAAEYWAKAITIETSVSYASIAADTGGADPTTTPSASSFSDLITYPLPVTVDGQTFFAFPAAPADLGDVALILDGLEFRAPLIVVSKTGVAWAGPCRIETDDRIFLRFHPLD